MMAARLIASVVVAAMLVWSVLQMPVDIPDTNSPLDANHSGTVNGGSTVGQTFVPNRDNLSRVEVVIAAERPLDQADLTFQIVEVPWRQSREVTRSISDIPVGKVKDFRPGTVTERWYSFEFDPFAGSAGKTFYFSLQASEVPEENSVAASMFFHNRYPFGQAHVNGDPVGASLVFRTYSRGRLLDLVSVLLGNLTTNKPGLIGSALPYFVIAGAYGLMSVVLLRTLLRRS